MRGEGVGGGRSSQRERGTALVVVLLVTVMLTLLGIPFMLMGETENRIAENERLAVQARYAAESGASLVKRWFDDPHGSDNVVNPPLAAIDLTQRQIDADGDPATAPVAADGSASKPYYKQGVDLDGNGQPDLFAKPYRGGPKHALVGTEEGPDLVIDEGASSAAAAFLGQASEKLFGAYPGGSQRARIIRIDVYAPPTVPDGGAWIRYGAATVKVRAGIFLESPDGSERRLAENVVRTVLNEIPYASGVYGPLHSCGDLAWNGPLTVHWGIVAVAGNADLPDDPRMRPAGMPRDVPITPYVDLLKGWNDVMFWNGYVEERVEDKNLDIDDPWFRLVAKGSIAEAPNANQQPWPLSWTSGGLGNGQIPFHAGAPDDSGSYPCPGCVGHQSNYFQNLNVGCPSYPYESWKILARRGGANVHYYSWAGSSDMFKRDGAGPASSFRDITHEQTGIFFFDTTDGSPPSPGNLTPPIAVGGDWDFRGLLYLNAQRFRVEPGAQGVDVAYRLPHEPFQDVNANGVFDQSAGEDMLRLNFSVPTPDASLTDTFGGSIMYNEFSASWQAPANLVGILYTSGALDSTGSGNFYGAVIAGSGVGEFETPGSTPNISWDPAIVRDWPPEEWHFPRVWVTSWEAEF